MISLGSSENQDGCPKCGSEQVWRQAFPYPVGLQVAFAVSFGAFLMTYERLPELPGGKLWLWGWTGFQVILGLILVKRRSRAKKRVLRCIRCG